MLDPNPTNTVDFIMMESRAYSTKNTWYVEYEVTGPPEQKEKYTVEVIQIPTVRDTVKSTNHKSNVLDLIKQNKEATRKRLEVFVHETRTSETVSKTIAQVHQGQKEDSKPLYRQITETFDPTPESIWEEIDMLECDPLHRGMVMHNVRFKP